MNLIEIAKAAYDVNGIGNNLINTSSDTVNINDIVSSAVTWVGIAAAVVAFFYLIFSGFMYLTAGGNPDQAKKGQQGILNAIIGLIIIALAWGIFTAVSGLINPAEVVPAAKK